MIHKLRSLLSDTAIYGVSTVVGRFLSFLLTPLYLNYLAPAEFGQVALLYSYIAFINIFFSFGMESAFFKFYSFDDDEKNRRAFSNAFFAIAIVGAFLTAVAWVAATPIAQFLDISLGSKFIRYSFLIAFLDALALIPFGVLRMKRRSKKFALTKFSVIAFNLAANLALVAGLHTGADGIFWAGIISSLLGVLLLLGEMRRYLVLDVDSGLLRAMAVFGLPTLPASFSAIILQLADRPILQAIAGDNAVGIYQAAYKLGIPMMMAVTVFEYAWKPFFLQHYRDREARRLFSSVLTYFTVFCAAIFLATGLFIEYVAFLPFVGGRFIPQAYMAGIGIIPIVLGAYYFLGIFTNLTAGVYLRRRTKYLSFVTGAAAAVNVVLNYILDPIYGMWGAAWATLGAYAVSALLLYCLTKRIYPIRYEWGKIFAIAGIAVAAFAGMKILTAGWEPAPAFFARLAGTLCTLGGILVVVFSREDLRRAAKLLKRK